MSPINTSPQPFLKIGGVFFVRWRKMFLELEDVLVCRMVLLCSLKEGCLGVE